ncbi:MAG TPA: hypothetical protein VFA54_04740 [Bryobacterales bacterium]|jgi:predicted GH43/DUF377 family glycosyl hydrolase|nr:hypothetical protein [Bryobacterales bacterium]
MTQNVVQRFSAPTQAAAILILLLHSGACGPAWLAKQAEFAVENCTALDGAPELSSWRWKVDPDPVLTRGPKGAWDSFDVLNPSVVFWNGLYYNLYSGFDGHTWRTGLATSVDGRHWEKFAGNPVLSPLPGSWEGDYIAANGSALHDGSQFLYWYHAGRPARIGLARSTDARHWQRLGPPVLEPGPEGSWDESGVADPYVLRCRDAYYLYYLGQNRRAVQRIGAARSPDGIHWQKFIGNPVLDPGPPGAFDERGVGEPAVFRAATEFYMIYTGRSAGETRRLGAARSSDGVHWQRAALAATIASGQPWDSHVVCDPSVLAVNGKLWLWFGGGDVARPDERLHGQIGLATASLNGR